MRQSIILILSILLFTACAERGNLLHPASNRILHKEILPLTAKKETTHKVIKKTNTTELNNVNKKMIKKIPFFHFIETKSKTLSALAIVAIGIMILL